MNSQIANARRPVVIRRGQAEQVAHHQERLSFLLTGDGTGGRVGLIERVVSPKFQSPPLPHCHTRGDWCGYLLDGRLVFELDGAAHELHGGDTLFVPRGVYFRWWNPDDTPARMLFIFMPGGFEQFFKDMVAATTAVADTLHDYQRTLPSIMQLHDRYGMVRKER